MDRIVWLGPMGSDSVSEQAGNLRDYLMKPACASRGFELYYPKVLSADNWLSLLFEKIASTRGLICDISGERCNVYLELGYALALKIPVLLVAQKGTHVHIDLANVQRHEYDGFDAIRDTVSNWLGSLDSALSVLQEATIGLPYPFTVLEGDGAHEYSYASSAHERPFSIEIDQSDRLSIADDRVIPKKVQEVLLEIHGLQLELADRAGRPLHKGELFGYVAHTPIREESGVRFGARVRCRPTDYFTFIATHYHREALADALEYSIISAESAKELQSRIRSYKDEGLWCYASPLTVNMFVLVNNGIETRLLFQKRAMNRNFHARFPIQATAAGMIHPSRVVDHLGDTSYSPEIAFLHELVEEAGIQLQLKEVRVLGLVREEHRKECGFVGYAQVVEKRVDERKIPIDVFESEKFYSVPFNPDTIAEFIRTHGKGGAAMVPLALAALSMLLTHEFGVVKMRDIFASATNTVVSVA